MMLSKALNKLNIPFELNHAGAIYVVTILAILAYIFEHQIGEILIYEREAITQGEFWRLFTGHLLHSNFYHFVMNVTGLLLLWILHGHFYTQKNTVLLFLISSLFISIALYYFSPTIHRYVGLSGILHSLFIFGVMLEIRNKDKIGILLFIGVWLKIANEQYFGPSEELAQLINAKVAIDAHLWGTVIGFIFTLVYLFLTPRAPMQTVNTQPINAPSVNKSLNITINKNNQGNIDEK
jgi:rhomboid family GlyGly-CTERM serine protease